MGNGRGHSWSGNLSDAIDLLNDYDFKTVLKPIEINKNILPERLLMQYKVEIGKTDSALHYG
jgi:hypothetical protein